MDQQMTRGEQNLLLLQSLIPASEKLYVWCYDRDGHFVASSCPEEERKLLADAFDRFGGMGHALAYAHDSGNTRPQIIGSPIGMQWALSYEPERNRRLFFVIGPVFYAPPLERQLRPALRPYISSREDAEWSVSLLAHLSAMPVMSLMR